MKIIQYTFLRIGYIVQRQLSSSSVPSSCYSFHETYINENVFSYQQVDITNVLNKKSRANAHPQPYRTIMAFNHHKPISIFKETLANFARLKICLQSTMRLILLNSHTKNSYIRGHSIIEYIDMNFTQPILPHVKFTRN